jgi:two-component system sensor histidine kinase KdpD
MPAVENVTRPSPDALLAEAQRHDRGRLKIFLGAAPGVGKTFEMLSVARRRRAEGVDVVVGIVETHGRAETEVLLQDLPQVPRRTVEHRGRTLTELDLDALLARKPKLALIDELAHTNVPGSRHAKRFQDVQELLDAGIDVYTTLNVQHLESFNDLVARITGVEIRETIPDAVLERAQDVELIDLSPDDLIDRLHQGKVYVPEQARRALDNYFSRGNLLALRELALRAAAERVDDDLSTFMRAHGIAGPWPARGRLIVCIDATSASENVVRVAKRLADQRHLPWTALCVQTLGAAISPAGREQLEANLALATQLGADSAIVTADRVGEAIVDYARSHNAAQIVIGRARDIRHRFWPRRRLAQWLFSNARDFEITVVAESDGKGSKRTRAPSSRRAPRDMLYAAAFTLGAAMLAWLLEPWVGVRNLPVIFLLGVTFAAALGGLVAALVSSSLSFVAYNFLFTEPRFSLVVNEPQDVATLLLFLAVSAVVGQLAARLRLQVRNATDAAQRVEVLFDFSRRLATAIDERDLLEAAASGIGDLMQHRCIVLRATSANRAESPAHLPAHVVDVHEFRDTDQAAADFALAHSEPAGRGTGTLPSASWYFVPIAQSQRALGVLGIELPSSTDTVSSEQHRLLFTLQSQLAGAWERFRLRQVAHDAQMQRATDSLRSALLASVSHDLRTPLVSITGSLTALRDLGSKMPADDRAQLLKTAILESERLNRLIQNLLDMTRLSHGALATRLVAVDVREVIDESISRLQSMLGGRSMEIDASVTLPPVRADRTLLEQVLVNVVENAAKFSPRELPIRIVASVGEEAVVICVSDEGLGIEEPHASRVFDLFYRAEQRDRVTSGSGLGLSISKGFIEAMGGSISARARQGRDGTTVEISLPIYAS